MERTKHLSRRDFLTLLALGTGAAACTKAGMSGSETSTLSPDELTRTPSRVIPTNTLTPEPSPTPDTRGYFERYIYPALLTVAENRRTDKAEKDPDFWHRVDKELNTQRINFVLLGFGSESRDGARLTDSNQIMPLNLNNNDLRIVSIDRDVWAPEIERETKYNTEHYRINETFQLGGMALEEKVIEDASGLSADFVLGMEMRVLSRAVREVFDDKLEVCIPWTINDVVMGYYKKGLQVLDGEDILKISRARQFTGGEDPQRAYMQQLILRTMMGRVRTELASGALKAAGFITKALVFFQKETGNGDIVANFDSGLFLNLGYELAKKVLSEGIGKNNGFGMPEFTSRYAIPVESAKDPYDVTRHVPGGGDPNASDLVTDYWASAREGIKKFLESPADTSTFEQGDTCTSK